MRHDLPAIAALLLALSSVSTAQTTQPASNDRLEFRAGQAFDRGDYATALPMLRRLVGDLKDRPAKLSAIRDRIKSCEKAMATRTTAPGQDAARTIHPPPEAGRTQAMTIKELGNFEYDADKGGNIPEDVKGLDGSRIRLTGFMIPVDQAAHITQFALVPSLFSCCFGQPPQVQHTIICTCPKGKSVSYCPDQIVVEGTLKVEEKREDGYITSIFQLEPNSIAVAPKDAKP